MSEKKRDKSHRSFYNSIEYQFGGKGEADLEKLLQSGSLDPFVPPYQPVCLDKIFRDRHGELKTLPSFFGRSPIVVDTRTNMQRLEELFWMDRARFPKKLPRRRMGTEIVYGWRAVPKIMDFLLRETRKFLLKEKSRKRKRPVLGPPKKLWLYDPKDPDLLPRVLKGIEARLDSLSVDEDIKAEFLKVIRRYLSDSANK